MSKIWCILWTSLGFWSGPARIPTWSNDCIEFHHPRSASLKASTWWCQQNSPSRKLAEAPVSAKAVNLCKGSHIIIRPVTKNNSIIKYKWLPSSNKSQLVSQEICGKKKNLDPYGDWHAARILSFAASMSFYTSDCINWLTLRFLTSYIQNHDPSIYKMLEWWRILHLMFPDILYTFQNSLQLINHCEANWRRLAHVSWWIHFHPKLKFILRSPSEDVIFLKLSMFLEISTYRTQNSGEKQGGF